MSQQFVLWFDQFGCGEVGGVSRCVVIILEEHFFLPTNRTVFSAIRHRIDPIIQHCRILSSFCPSRNQCRLCLTNPIVQIVQSTPSSAYQWIHVSSLRTNDYGVIVYNLYEKFSCHVTHFKCTSNKSYIISHYICHCDSYNTTLHTTLQDSFFSIANRLR